MFSLRSAALLLWVVFARPALTAQPATMPRAIAPAPQSDQQAPSPSTGETVFAECGFRSGHVSVLALPGKSSIVATLKCGEAVMILGEEKEGPSKDVWYKIRNENGKEGYVGRWFVSTTKPPPQTSKEKAKAAKLEAQLRKDGTKAAKRVDQSNQEIAQVQAEFPPLTSEQAAMIANHQIFIGMTVARLQRSWRGPLGPGQSGPC